MKTKTSFSILLSVTIMFLFSVSCTRKGNRSETTAPVDITLKSVSLIYDSLGSDPSEMRLIFNRINSLIDSIGYPGVGYKLWIVRGDSTKGFRLMVEGSWPSQAVYDSIHNSKVLKDLSTDFTKKFWKGKKSVSYNRYDLVK